MDIMARYINQTTATAQAGTKEWLEAIKGMIIVAYVGAGDLPSAQMGTKESKPSPTIFGTHIKEALEAWGLR